MPKVSVIIPVYGVERYIERCAQSLFEQTLDDVEYLFIDDCTPDKSIDILKQVLEKYPHRKNQVIIHRMKSNSGQAHVRKWGIQHASGEYVIHCDSDDWVDINMYSSMYAIALRDNSDVVVCDYNFTDGFSFSQRIKACNTVDKDLYFWDIIYQKTSWSVWNKLVRKEIYDSIESYPQYAMGEDMVLMIQLLCSCKNISYLKKNYYNYYYNPNSIMHSQRREQCRDKYLQLKGNTEVLLQFLRKKYDDKVYKKIEAVLTYNLTIPLFPYIHEKDFLILWKREMLSHYRILFDRKVKKIFKIMYLLIVSKIYPFYKRLK